MGEKRADRVGQPLPRRRQTQYTRRPTLNDLDPQLSFQPLDPLRQGWRRQVQPRSRSSEVALLGEGEEAGSEF
jgi:hypothetical protein